MEQSPETPVHERYYVLEQLENAAQTVELITDALPIYREQVAQLLPKSKAEAQKVFAILTSEREKLVQIIRRLPPYLQEAGEPALAQGAETLAGQLAAFNLLTPDYAKLAAALNAFATSIPTREKASAAVIGRLMNSVRMGHYPTDLDNVAHITKGIAFPPGVITNVLDPCCGTGAALRKLATGNNCFAYGVELDESRAQEAQERLHRVGFGSFFQSRISHDAFHVVFLNPPYLSVLGENGRARDEKKFLVESIPHLMPGGLMIYIVPYYRMTDDICRIFCDNFTDVSAYRFTAEEFKTHHQLAVLGLRCLRRDGTAEAEQLAALAYKPEALPSVEDIPEGRYALPGEARTVDIFKGAQFNVDELARQLKASTSFDRFFAKATTETGQRHPPLPLSIGQVGLIGGSGLINGLMDCDCPHIIKGRIVKVKRTESEELQDYTGRRTGAEIRETTTNKMVFNILTPSGFKSLA